MKILIEVLCELLKRALRGNIKGLLILFACLNLVGCLSAGGAGDAAAVSGPGAGPGADTPIVVTEKTGQDFSCVAFNISDRGQIWCRASGLGFDARLGALTPSYQLYVEKMGEITEFETWDDTICWSAEVSDRPFDNTSGEATYCHGDASFGVNYATYPIVYSPPYDESVNGSPDFETPLEDPFAGGNVSMDVMTDTGGVWLVMTDSSGSVSETTETCDLSADEMTLTCAGFSLTLQ